MQLLGVFSLKYPISSFQVTKEVPMKDTQNTNMEVLEDDTKNDAAKKRKKVERMIQSIFGDTPEKEIPSKKRKLSISSQSTSSSTEIGYPLKKIQNFKSLKPKESGGLV